MVDGVFTAWMSGFLAGILSDYLVLNGARSGKTTILLVSLLSPFLIYYLLKKYLIKPNKPQSMRSMKIGYFTAITIFLVVALVAISAFAYAWRGG